MGIMGICEVVKNLHRRGRKYSVNLFLLMLKPDLRILPPFPLRHEAYNVLSWMQVGFWFPWLVEYDRSDILISEVKCLMPISTIG